MNPIYFYSDGLHFLLPKNAHPLVEGFWLRLAAEELDQRLHGRLTATFFLELSHDTSVPSPCSSCLI
jgi:hypothetical protein